MSVWVVFNGTGGIGQASVPSWKSCNWLMRLATELATFYISMIHVICVGLGVFMHVTFLLPPYMIICGMVEKSSKW